MTYEDHMKVHQFVAMAMIGHIDIDKSKWSVEQFAEHSKSYYAMSDAAFRAMQIWARDLKELKNHG